jgi:membrane protease YdiL (CAAX protease family)
MTSEQLRPPLASAAPPRRHPLDLIVDRPRREAALAVGAAWLAFMAGLIAIGEVSEVISFVIGGVSAAVVVWLGFAAASRCRTLPEHSNAHRARLGLLSLAAGAGLGIANRAANWMIAAVDPAIRASLAERFETVPLPKALFVAPVVEEIVVRLFLLSALAWIAYRVTRRPGLAFAVALVSSALFFAALHLDRPMPADPVVADYYRAALMAKYTVLALPLGLIFWRWGLPYAILCHATINATYFALQALFF